MKKIISLVCALSLVLVACGGTSNNASTAAPATESGSAAASGGSDERVRIGLSVASETTNFSQGLVVGARMAAEKYNVDLQVVVADQDAAKQQQQCETLIAQGIQGIAISPIDADAIGETMRKIREAGIPNVVIDRAPNDMTNVDAFVAADDEQVGEIMAKTLVEGCEKYGVAEIKCIEIVGSLKDNSAMLRDQGIQNVKDELGIDIVAQVNSEWDTESCYNRLNDAIEACGGDFNAIICPSDFLINTVLSCLEANGRKHTLGTEGAVIIVSGDGAPAGVKMVKEDYVYATINTDAFHYTELAIKALADIIRGNELENPRILVQTLVVTKEVAMTNEEIWGNVFADQA